MGGGGRTGAEDRVDVLHHPQQWCGDPGDRVGHDVRGDERAVDHAAYPGGVPGGKDTTAAGDRVPGDIGVVVAPVGYDRVSHDIEVLGRRARWHVAVELALDHLGQLLALGKS